jgi:hypothetical protein
VNSTAVELALKKQRLQIASDGLRADFGLGASGLMPVFIGADMAVAVAHWVRRNKELVVAMGVALLVIRPRSAVGWARRAFVFWRIWRNFEEFLDRRLPPPRRR